MTQGENFHHLDLPCIAIKPSFTVLCEWLEIISKSNPALLDFGSSSSSLDDDKEEHHHHVAAADKKQVMKWLTCIISSQLDWIQSFNDREFIYTMASQCLAQMCGRYATPTSHRTINFPSSSTSSVIINEPPLTGDNMGFKTWGSAYMLSCRLLKGKNNNLLTDPILELGSGTGLCGMVIAHLGYNIIMTDLNPIINNLIENIKLNKDFIGKDNINKCHVGVLDWSNPDDESSLEILNNNKFPCITICDAIYSHQHPALLVSMIKKFLLPNTNSTTNPRVLVQLPIRKGYNDLYIMFKSMLASQLDLYPVISDIEYGFDDFGECSYEFSLYTYR